MSTLVYKKVELSANLIYYSDKGGDNMHIGERIKIKRLELGMTQTELAQKMGYVSKTSICKVEKGSENLTTDRVTKFAEALNTTESYLMGWDDETPKTKENAVVLADIMKDPKMFSYVKTFQTFTDEQKEIIYSYIDFIKSSSH